MLALTAAVGALAVGDADMAPAAQAALQECGAVAATEGAALAQAAQCGLPVPVESSRSEYIQVVAKPDGRLTFESAIEPQRAKQADDSWADVDLTLSTGSDNLVRPAVSAADVTFSHGGTGSFVTLKRAGKTLGLSWPGQLPTPTLSGDAATYPNVLPDVDLVLRATRTGFTHVLVVKTAEAAEQPGVRHITLGVTGDAELVRLPDGSLQAVADGKVVGRAERAVMWDSSQPSELSAVRSAESGFGLSNSFAAGDAAKTGEVQTEVDAEGNLKLTPDAELLDSPETTYPVYIDPTWSVAKSKWAYGTSNNCTNTDYTVARVGLSPEGPCSGVKFRSYFEFPTTNGSATIKGKHIESAYVQMKLYHSWSCGNTWAHMYLTPVINATMKASYSSMTLKTWLAAAEGHANKETGCSDSPQSDMTMNFINSAVTNQVQTASNGNWNTVTVGFCACNDDGDYESTQDRWKKFYPGNAKLIVDYDTIPGKPTSLQVAGVACKTSAVTMIGTTTPTFSAIYPDADSGQGMWGNNEWIEVPAGGMGAVTDTYPTRKTPPTLPWPSANTRGTSGPVTAPTGKTYAFRVQGRDPAPYYKWGPWSDWCQFSVDTADPIVTVTPVGTSHWPGKEVTFNLSADSDVTTFHYGWVSGLENTIAATGTGSNPRTATVKLTVPKYGRNILYVTAVDATLNEGSGSAEIIAQRPTPHVAGWGLETYPGRTQAQALADDQPSIAGDTPLTATSITWPSDLRLVDGESASFNGSTSKLATTVPVIDTTGSFSVAAWVRLTSDSNYHTAVSGDGSQMSLFRLGYRLAENKWCFTLRAKDDIAEANNQTHACGSAPVVGRWTHLAGVYDDTTKKISLYVDGALASTTTPSSTFLTVWNGGQSISRLTVGQALDTTYTPSGVNEWEGQIVDVQVFDRVLVNHDFTGQLASDPASGGFDEPGILNPIKVASWGFELGVPCYIQDFRDTCEVPGGGFGRWLALQRGASIADGNRGAGLHLDGYYFPEENPEPWETTSEWGRSAYKTGATPPDMNGDEFTIWQDTPVLRTDQSFTISAWGYLAEYATNQTIVSQVGSYDPAAWIKYSATTGNWEFTVSSADNSSAMRKVAVSPAAAVKGDWVHLVGVYDASAGEVRLYINGDRASTNTLTWTPMQSSGTLQVGRTIWHGSYLDYWHGGVDDVFAYQGAMTDAQVRLLHQEQLVSGLE